MKAYPPQQVYVRPVVEAQSDEGTEPVASFGRASFAEAQQIASLKLLRRALFKLCGVASLKLCYSSFAAGSL